MSFIRALQPLRFDRIDRADFGVVTSIELDPDDVARFLGPLDDIATAVRKGLAHAAFAIRTDAGVVGFYVLHPDLRDAACWWLGWFAIDHRMQGRGFGRASMAHLMAGLRRIPNCRRVRLLVAPDNRCARRLYEQASFRRVAVSSSGELVLEANLSGTFTYAVLPAVMIRLVAAPGHQCHVGRLRSAVGPYAAPTIGVERGPPTPFHAAALRVPCSALC